MTASVFEIGKSTVRILIPSRRKDGAIVAAETRSDWEARSRKVLETSPFGGSTPTNVIGSFVHDDGRVTRENVTVLTSTCGAEALADEAARQQVLHHARDLCAALGQESIFIGWGDTAYLVSESSDLESIPIIPFASLGPEVQQKHLTMGWGGIASPARVLQVLSLDTWTLPRPTDRSPPPDGGPLVLRAVLREPGRLRRAWSWGGDTAGLRAARRTWAGDAPTEGDLVFLQSKPDYLDVALVTGSGLAGPRDLRLSHSQLNPVTRHLLMRILKREWDALARDLEQRPLDRGFFPKLQKLRSAVEQAVKAEPGPLPPSKAAQRGSKAKKGKASSAAAPPQRSAFKTSVLVVGRMMFLRFLAQKEWLPGGVDGLIAAHQAHGERFFHDHVLPLWFDVLNKPTADRSAATRKVFSDGFPYLNGGLFLPRAGEAQLQLPDELFDPDRSGSFLQLFRDFEFSLNEHAGSDDSIKIDPSLFGKALETFNSLEDRKSEGVHYTPKPIAWALALDAILRRVERLTGIERQRLDRLLRGEASLNGLEAKSVSQALGGLRIIDPAVGSGVLLWASLEVLLALDSACDAIFRGSTGYQRGTLAWGQRSRHFVCNCLHGVDLSEEAVELTRLRLWLAVALSESHPQPLPDLDLNIVQGDSLLPAPGRPEAHGRKASQLKLGLDERDRLEQRLETLTHRYLSAGESNPVAQRKHRKDVLEVRRELAAAGRAEAAEEPQLDWRTFFPHVFRDEEKQGFDVVIANPPYIRIQESKAGGRDDVYRATWSTLATGNADLSYAFVELALRDLAAPDGGQVAFIQPNFRHHDAAAALRRILLGRNEKVPARLRLWVDFDDTQVFPTATNYVSLLFAERTPKAEAQETFDYCNPEAGSWQDSEDLRWMYRPRQQGKHPADAEEWLTVPGDLRERVLRARKTARFRLGDLAEIHVGVQTSADTVFLFEEAREAGDGLLELVPRGGERAILLERAALRRCVKGSARGEFYLLFPYDLDGQLLSQAVLRKSLPKAWSYLVAQKAKLEGREGGKFKGPDWYRFGRRQGYAVAVKPKVLVPSLLRQPAAIVDREGALAFTASGKGGGGAWALVPKEGIALEELERAVMTEVAWDHILVSGSPQQGGWRGIDRDVLDAIPVLRGDFVG